MEDNFLHSLICTQVYKNWFIFFIDMFLKEIMNIISQKKCCIKIKFSHIAHYMLVPDTRWWLWKDTVQYEL